MLGQYEIEQENKEGKYSSDIKLFQNLPFETHMERAAYAFAKWAHDIKDQRRKYTNNPYIVHPYAVAKIVESYGFSQEAICAALLHDTVEDTYVTLELIKRKFGQRVHDLVEMLTDVSKPSDGNRATRKAIDLEHTAKADYEGKSIKLADLINNAPSIIKNDPGFARKWMKEKENLLEKLSDGHPELYLKAKSILENYRKGKN